MEVIPARNSLAVYLSSPSTRCSGVSAGTRRRTSMVADPSTSTPVSSPAASRTITPPSGLGVFLLTPASVSARELTTAT